MTTSDGIHIDGTLDGQVDLLDRQIVSSDGRMVAKVDDIELEERADGSLIVSGLLIGLGALGPRLGGALEHIVTGTWSRLTGRAANDAERIDYTHITGISTVLTIDETRRAIQVDRLERWARTRIIDALPGAGNDPDPGEPGSSTLGSGPSEGHQSHRLSRLAGMTVQLSDGTSDDQVTDVRFERSHRRGHLPGLSATGLIVGRNRPGTLFGYDRDRQKGPWLIQMVLRRVHRRTAYAHWTDVTAIDWDARVVHLRTSAMRPLPEP